MTAAVAGGSGGGDSATSSNSKSDSWFREGRAAVSQWRLTSSGDAEIAAAATSSDDEIAAAEAWSLKVTTHEFGFWKNRRTEKVLDS